MDVDKETELKVQIAVLQTQLNSLIISVTELKTDLRSALVKVSADTPSKDEFTLMKRILFGLVGIVLTAVAVQIVNFFITKRV